MIVKFMSCEDVGDDDSRKLFRLVSGVKSIRFARRISPTEGAIASLILEDGLCYDEEVFGSVYVMNDTGKTVSSFCPNTPPCNPVVSNPHLVPQ